MSVVSSQLFEAEMHLYNPLLKGETFLLSCLILCSVLLQGNKLLLLHFRSLVTQLCYVDSWKHLNALDSISFCATLCVSLCEKGSNLLCTYAIFFSFVSTQSEIISSPLFCMALIPISL